MPTLLGDNFTNTSATRSLSVVEVQCRQLITNNRVRSQTVEFYILNSQGLPAIVRQAAQRATPRLINRYSAGNNYF